MMKLKVVGFEWDDGNWPKCNRHGLSKADIEAVFQSDVAIFEDPSSNEERLRAIGQLTQGRMVFIVLLSEDGDQTDKRALHAPEGDWAI